MGRDTQQEIKNEPQKSTKQSQWKNPKGTNIQQLFAEWEDSVFVIKNWIGEKQKVKS